MLLPGEVPKKKSLSYSRRSSVKRPGAAASSLRGCKKAVRNPNWRTEPMDKAMQEILALYKPGWPFLAEKEKASFTAIARALIRKGLVSSYRNDYRLMFLLKELALLEKISLPPKSKKGGPRDMKAALQRKKQ